MLRVAMPAMIAPLIVLAFAACLGAADSGTVSVRELAIPDKAKDKYADAQRKLARKDTVGGRKRLEEAVALAPEYAAAWNALGVIAADAREAEANFRKAVACDPDNAEAAMNLGGLLLKTGRAEEGLGYSERAAEALRADAAAQAQLGMNLYQLGRLSEAERAFVVAKRLNSEDRSMPQLFLAEIYARRGEKARALAEIADLLARKPDPAVAATLKAAAARLHHDVGPDALPTPR